VDKISTECPATVLRRHPGNVNTEGDEGVHLWLDEPAASLFMAHPECMKVGHERRLSPRVGVAAASASP
jgi:hypothetical protein